MDDDRIRLLDVFEKQVETSTRLAVLAEQLKENTRSREDHEKRLRKLETWRHALPASLILAAGSAILAALQIMH
jgi:hypothetical protein